MALSGAQVSECLPDRIRAKPGKPDLPDSPVRTLKSNVSFSGGKP